MAITMAITATFDHMEQWTAFCSKLALLGFMDKQHTHAAPKHLEHQAHAGHAEHLHHKQEAMHDSFGEQSVNAAHGGLGGEPEDGAAPPKTVRKPRRTAAPRGEKALTIKDLNALVAKATHSGVELAECRRVLAKFLPKDVTGLANLPPAHYVEFAEELERLIGAGDGGL